MTDLPGWFRDEPAAQPPRPPAGGGSSADTDPDVMGAGRTAPDTQALSPQAPSPQAPSASPNTPADATARMPVVGRPSPRSTPQNYRPPSTSPAPAAGPPG